MTDSLDGESSLKSKQVLQRCQDTFIKLIKEKELRIRVEEPNKNIHEFKGTIEYSFKGKQEELSHEIEELNEKQFIPKGSTLKLTDYVYCIVIYTGYETKLM